MDQSMLHESKFYVLKKYICNIQHSDSCNIERLHQLIDDGVKHASVIPVNCYKAQDFNVMSFYSQRHHKTKTTCTQNWWTSLDSLVTYVASSISWLSYSWVMLVIRSSKNAHLSFFFGAEFAPSSQSLIRASVQPCSFFKQAKAQRGSDEHGVL